MYKSTNLSGLCVIGRTKKDAVLRANAAGCTSGLDEAELINDGWDFQRVTASQYAALDGSFCAFERGCIEVFGQKWETGACHFFGISTTDMGKFMTRSEVVPAYVMLKLSEVMEAKMSRLKRANRDALRLVKMDSRRGY